MYGIIESRWRDLSYTYPMLQMWGFVISVADHLDATRGVVLAEETAGPLIRDLLANLTCFEIKF